jgi:hypothetical protein
MARATELEPATSCRTGRRLNQLIQKAFSPADGFEIWPTNRHTGLHTNASKTGFRLTAVSRPRVRSATVIQRGGLGTSGRIFTFGDGPSTNTA